MLHRHSCLPACQRVTGHRLLRLLTRGIATRENQLRLPMPSAFAAVHESEAGTNLPFAALRRFRQLSEVLLPCRLRVCGLVRDPRGCC